MFCIYCGAQIPDQSAFCPHCGRQEPFSLPRLEPSGEQWFRPAPYPFSQPQPQLRQKSKAPFVLILVVYFLWFFWRTSGLDYVVFQISLRELSPEIAASVRELMLSRVLQGLTNIGLPHLAALAGLIAVLVLVSQKKIDRCAFSWKDVVSMAVLCAAIPASLLLPLYCVGRYCSNSDPAAYGFSYFWQIIRGPAAFALAVVGLWAACIIFLLIRSGTLQVTRKKALICLGAAFCVSLILTVYCSGAVQDYIKMVYRDAPDTIDVANIIVYAQMITRLYCILLWIKWMVLFWFAADSGSGLLPFWGRLVFAGVVAAGLWFICLELMVDFQLGPQWGVLMFPAAFLLGAVVLLIFRLVHHTRAAKQTAADSRWTSSYGNQ